MRWRGIVGAVALCCGVTAQAQAAACWDARTVEAAQIRQFDIMLMVSTLRCQVKGVELVADYNAFVRSNKALLIGANDEILRHFNSGMGGQAALAAYDRFGTAMANQFGKGGVSEDCETIRSIVRDATAGQSAPNRERLLGAAQGVGMEPVLPGGLCGAQVAEGDAQPGAPARRVAMTR